MGLLIIQGNRKYSFQAGNGFWIKRDGNYKSDNSISNLLRYISRTRDDEDRRADLKVFGCIGVDAYGSIDFVIQQFRKAQQLYYKDNGRRMYHFVYSFSDKEIKIINGRTEVMARIAYHLAELFHRRGFQVAYAVHEEPAKRLHIHFAVNAVSYLTGYKFHISKPEVSMLQQQMTYLAGLWAHEMEVVWFPQSTWKNDEMAIAAAEVKEARAKLLGC